LGKEPVVVAAATATADNSFDEYCCGDDEEIAPALTSEYHEMGNSAGTGTGAGSTGGGRKEDEAKCGGGDGNIIKNTKADTDSKEEEEEEEEEKQPIFDAGEADDDNA
jgi:hypothetical protein